MRAAGWVTGCGLIGALAACGAAHDAATAPLPASTGATATTTATAAPTGANTTAAAAPSSTVSRTDLSSVPACTTADLAISVGAGEGAGGTSYLPLIFRNVSTGDCSLYGYPGVSYADSDGVQVGQPAHRVGIPSGSSASTVSLAPGGTASAQLSYANSGTPSAAACAPASADRLVVYPPAQTGSRTITIPTDSVCTTAAYGPNITPLVEGSDPRG